jgi:agmatine deiminase
MKWRDSEADTIYAASELAFRHPRIAKTINAYWRVKWITGTSNIWIRDYFPVQVGDGFIQFRYTAAGYGGIARYPQLKPPRLFSTRRSRIVLEGAGNCVRYDDRAIITDIVFKHNQSIPKPKLIGRLEKLLDAEVIIIPREPDDEMGHADGIARFIDAKTVFVNDYSVMSTKKHAAYENKLVHALAVTGLSVLPFPFAYQKTPVMREATFRKRYPGADSFNPGFGYYINYLHVKGLILVPSFGIDEDGAAVAALRGAFPATKVTPVDCRELSMYGGLLNCVTATTKAT